jgi:4-amino-4-deoxy-L-arabinose transferase-like glycosyltransferase
LRQVLRDRPAAVESLVFLGFLAIAFVLSLSRILRASYDRDEGQFIASARLLADHSLLPYRDYPYFHTPYLTLLYALVLPLAGHYNLLAARTVSLVCACAALLILVAVTRDVFRRHPPGTRGLAVVGVVLLLSANPLFAYANQRAWNHSVPLLFTLLAFALCYFGSRRRRAAWWTFAAGLCLGVAVGTRSSFLTVLPAFLVALAFYPPAETSRWRLLLAFCLGTFVAIIPVLIFLLASPARFIFGNLEYPRLNALYRTDFPSVFGAMTLPEKFDYVWKSVIAQPANLLLLLAFLTVVTILIHRHRVGQAPRFVTSLILLIPPFLVIGSFLPTPSWYQYYYAPVPFMVMVIAFGLASLTRWGGSRATWLIVAFSGIVVVANLVGLEDYRNMRLLLHPETWRPLQFHSIGADVRAALGDASSTGHRRILTLGPLFPLEAGLDIYPAFATGPFAWRTARYLDAKSRVMQGFVSSEELDAYLADAPPDGILVGIHPNLEEPFIRYAERNGYRAVRIAEDLRLWVRPEEEAP